MAIEVSSSGPSSGVADTGVLFVPGVPRPVLNGLTALARLRGQSRAAYVREFTENHVAAAASLAAAAAESFDAEEQG